MVWTWNGIGGPERGGEPFVRHIPYAATVVFAAYILRGEIGIGDLRDQAADVLMAEQRADGSWPTWATDEVSCIEASSMAIHAIWAAKPRGWQRAVETAAHWLWSVQDEAGYWSEEGTPDSVYLTVLALDAVDLARGSPNVTFSGPRLPAIVKMSAADHASSKSPRRAGAQDPRFLVALSFPGEVRGIVQPVASELASILGRSSVFYDTWYKAELARPNLDTYLQDIYANQSLLIAIFLARGYETKEWCGLEWRAIRELIKKRRDDHVMPIRLDDTDIPGLFSLDGYVDAQPITPPETAQLIIERLNSLREQGRKLK
jgi:hypothetical protein